MNEPWCFRLKWKRSCLREDPEDPEGSWTVELLQRVRCVGERLRGREGAE